LDQIVISWRDNSDNEDGFIIERYDPGRGWVLVGATNSNTVSFTDTVPYKWLFQYRVAAKNSAGTSAYTEPVTVTSWAPEDPFVPQNIRVTGTLYSFGESITLPETLGAGTLIGVISSDDDTPGGDGHTYSLWSPPNGSSFCNDWFYIQGSSLFLKKAFDYETKPGICTIQIQARDSHGNFRTDHIVVYVADTDEPPSDIRLSRNTVHENLPAGTEVGKFSTSDDEGDTEHAYSLTEGDGDSGNGFFVIEGNVLKTKAVLDYEAGSDLSIRVTSRAASGGSVTRQFTMEILDAPDAPAISEIANQSTDDEVPATVNFTVSDQDTAAKYLTLSGKSDSQDVLPDGNIIFGGSEENRTLTLTPVAGKAGTANITVTVSDGSQRVSTEFKLTVTTGPNIKSEIRTDTETAAPGSVLTFTALISNTGDRTAENVTFALPVPENTEFVSGTASAGSVLRQSRGVSYRAETNEAEWTGDIPAGETAEITFEVRVNADVKRGSAVVISQGTVSSDGGSPDGSSAASDPIPVTVEGCLKGDADGNGILEIRDALISLQAAAGIVPEEICPDADANGDGKIGAEEAVYILNNL
jgi:uncharacterized repeat protein (TIGR01451 family)